MCLVKKYLDNYVATPQGTGRSHALVEGGERGGNALVESVVRCRSSPGRLMGRMKGMG
jgi:hypothetical protein